MVEGTKVDITPDQNGGVLKEILVEGSGGSPPKGVKVIVHYVGKLTDGKQFDSSRDRGDPFTFTLGRGEVIKGWDIGVASMKKGEKCLLTCREDFAYGASGSPPTIPPKATLVFEVELLDWEAEDLSGKSDRGVLRHPIEPGTGVDSPKDMANVDVTLVGTLDDGKEFFNSRLSFNLGEGVKHNVPRGIEKALRKMVMKEKSKIEIKSKYGFGTQGNEKLGVPPDANLNYTVTLHDFEIVKDTWAMTSTEKLDRARILKDKGTAYLKEGQLHLALKMYNKLVEIVDYDGGFEGIEEEERKKLLIAGHLNLSMTYLKLENMVSCKDSCNKALEQDSKSVKALFRRGQAYLGMKEPQLAIKDFKAVLEIEPQNKAAQTQVAVCQQQARQIKENEKKIYANMFEKFAKKDKEWRYGWWEKNQPKVELIDDTIDKEIAKERKKEFEMKKKFLEQKAKEKKEQEEKLKQGITSGNSNSESNSDGLKSELTDPDNTGSSSNVNTDGLKSDSIDPDNIGSRYNVNTGLTSDLTNPDNISSSSNANIGGLKSDSTNLDNIGSSSNLKTDKYKSNFVSSDGDSSSHGNRDELKTDPVSSNNECSSSYDRKGLSKSLSDFNSEDPNTFSKPHLETGLTISKDPIQSATESKGNSQGFKRKSKGNRKSKGAPLSSQSTSSNVSENFTPGTDRAE